MDIDTLHARRRAHLERLIRERFKGNKSAFAREVERYPTEISRWLKQPQDDMRWSRNMSEASARHIEEYLELEMGYLDRPLHSDTAALDAHEPPATYHAVTKPNGCVSTVHSSSPPVHSLCRHDKTETECRHCTLVKSITQALHGVSLERLELLSMVVDAFRSKK